VLAVVLAVVRAPLRVCRPCVRNPPLQLPRAQHLLPARALKVVLDLAVAAVAAGLAAARRVSPLASTARRLVA